MARQKIDRDLYTADWCREHSYLSGVKLGQLWGVDPRTARQYVANLGVQLDGVKGRRQTPKDCPSCKKQEACWATVRQNMASLCEEENEAKELEEIYQRLRLGEELT
jgi:hypothetical protein